MRTCLMALVMVVAVAAPLAAEDWPRFRGPTGQGLSSETGLPTEWSATSNVAWKTPIPGEGWSSPVVSGGRVFLTAATDGGRSYRALGLDAATGAVRWDTEVLRQEPDNKAGQNSYASATPVVDGDRLYVLAADGSLAALATDGKVLWTNREFKYYSQHGLGVSPVAWNDLIIVPFDWSSRGPDKTVGWQKPWEDSVILAYAKADGQIRWRAKRGSSRIAHVTPQVVTDGGRALLLSAAGDVVQGFDPATGERLWSATNTGEGVVPSLVVGGGMVFQTSGFGDPSIRAVRLGGRGDVTATHIAWEHKKDVPMIPSMLYADGRLFAVTEGGMATCLDAAGGKVLWRSRLPGTYSASPVWAEGRVYFLSEKGETTVVAAGPEFKVLATSALGEKCCASPAISGGRFFIRTEKNLYCIGAAKEGKPE
ncbi:MAG: PQQ-binding-like beta-propeller repeat protein [Planctomycetes bacterium]|nr:PQQ-binding-like beta-propeller repeat protein [Planctomycetota bacterium]